MNFRSSFFFRAIALPLLAIVFIRMLPLLIAMIQSIVLGVRAFAWAIIPTLVITAIIWKITGGRSGRNSRNSFQKKSKNNSNSTASTAKNSQVIALPDQSSQHRSDIP